MLKKLLSGALIFTVLPQLPKLLSIVTLPFITAKLSAADYGIYGIITAYIGFAGFLKELGFSIFFVNSYYKRPHSYQLIWRHLQGILYGWSLVYGLVLALLLVWAIPEQASQHLTTILWLNIIPIVLLDTAPTVSSLLYRVQDKPLPIGLISLLTGAIQLILTYYLIVVLDYKYMGWFYATFISSVIGFLCHAYHLYFQAKLLPVFSYHWRHVKRYLSKSPFLILHDYSAYLLNTSDRMVMDWLKIDVRSIGLYNIAYTFGGYFSFFETAMGMAATPLYLKYYSEGKYIEARRLTFLSQVIFLLATFSVSIWMKEIFNLLVRNDEFRGAYALSIIIVMSYNYKPMYQAATNVLFYREKIKTILKVSFLAGFINVVLNLILIPYIGYQIAAYTTFACLMYMGFAGFMLKDYREEATISYYPFLWFMIIILTTVAAYLLKDSPLVIKAIITATLALIVVYLFRKYKGLILE
jgi:O-antigen/teichoic acid export membrane protein